MTATRTTVETKRVTLYVVQSPTGNRILCAKDPATLLYVPVHYPDSGHHLTVELVTGEGWSVEPIEYAPVPSPETREAVEHALIMSREAKLPGALTALSELSQAWSGKEPKP